MAEYAVLPEEFENIGIKDLLENEVAYAVPWSVWVKTDGTASINGTFSFEESPEGTLEMKVTKQKDIILVYLNTIKNHKFTKSEAPPHMGANEEDYIPVKFIK